MPHKPVKTAQRQIQAIEWKTNAYRMRAAGATIQQIADAVGKSYTATSNALMEMMKNARERNAQELEYLRDLELDRLDQLMVRYWQGALSGNLDHAAMVLRIMERRARLSGIDAPIKTDSKIDIEDNPLVGQDMRDVVRSALAGMGSDRLKEFGIIVAADKTRETTGEVVQEDKT